MNTDINSYGDEMVMESHANMSLDDFSRFLLVSNVSSPGCVNPFHTNFKHYIPLAAKDLSISLGSKNPNISLNVCKCSTEKIYSTRNIGTQTVSKCYSNSSTLLPDYKKTFLSPSGIEPATDVMCHNISVAPPTLLLLTFSVLVANPKNYFTRWPIPLVGC